MRKYTAKECSCWSDYPNRCYKKPDQWKCVELYKTVRAINHITVKTKCVMIEEAESENEQNE